MKLGNTGPMHVLIHEQVQQIQPLQTIQFLNGRCMGNWLSSSWMDIYSEIT